MPVETLWQDIRFAVRMLRKSPGFTAVALFTLALGIGANTAIFSLVHTVLLQPIPYPAAERLIAISQSDSRTNSKGLSLSLPKFEQIAEQTRTLESVAVYYLRGMSLATPHEPEALSGARVSADFFRVLGVAPARGRTFLPEEDLPDAADVAMVTDGFWHSHFAADHDVLGRSLVLDGNSVTVIGVLPVSFRFPFETPEPQVWLSRVSEHPLLKPLQVNMGAGYLSGIARRRSGQTIAQAKAELGIINAGYAQKFAGHADGPNHDLEVESLQENLVGGLRRSLLVLSGSFCSLLAPISPICCWRAARPARRNSLCEEHWARRTAGSFDNCSAKVSCWLFQVARWELFSPSRSCLCCAP